MREISIFEAEKIAGQRLDRRRKYATTDDGKPSKFFGDGGHLLFMLCNWTDSCSGCTETSDGYNVYGYPVDPKHGCLVGGGCHECGYTGKRRNSMWVPFLA